VDNLKKAVETDVYETLNKFKVNVNENFSKISTTFDEIIARLATLEAKIEEQNAQIAE
jgi:hypothetical protein